MYPSVLEVLKVFEGKSRRIWHSERADAKTVGKKCGVCQAADNSLPVENYNQMIEAQKPEREKTLVVVQNSHQDDEHGRTAIYLILLSTRPFSLAFALVR